VWDLGFKGTRVGLAARVLSGFYAGLFVTNVRTGGSRWFISTPLGTNLSGNVVLLPDPSGGSHFPYGLPVEPDLVA
jgi:hypothetical protein